MHHFVRLRALALAALAAPSLLFATGGTLGGLGTVASPWLIADYADLKMIAQGSYTRTGHYRIVADIDASASKTENGGAGYFPVATDGNPKFTGTLSGAGHTITNLYCNRPTYSNVGLIGYLGVGGVVDSLSLENVFMSGYNSTGAVVGANRGGTIRRCFASGTVNGALDWTGGIVGFNESETANGVVEKCFSVCSVYGAHNTVGGIAGQNGTGAAGKAVIRYCYSAGLVQVAGSYAGGVAGHSGANGFVDTSYALVSLVSGGYLGGLIGPSGGTVTSGYYSSHAAGGVSGLGTARTVAQMKLLANYAGFDTAATWRIASGLCSPVLKNLPTRALAFPDSVRIRGFSATAAAMNLIANDYAPATGTDSLVCRLVKTSSGTVTATTFTFPSTIALGAVSHVFYQVGEKHGADTLWGGFSRAVVIRDSLHGSGTLADPYQIGDYLDLKAIGIGSVYTCLKHYKLTNDIDASLSQTENGGAGFWPIGRNVDSLRGSIDGDNHTISNLKIWRGENELGLVGWIGKTAVVKNIIFKNSTIGGRWNCGTVAGRNWGTVSNCHVYGKMISVQATNDAGNHGGVVGINYGRVTLSSFAGYTAPEVGYYVYYKGGIVGLLAETGRVDRCVNTGSIESNVSAGGIVGYISTSTGACVVEKCYNTGTIFVNAKVAGGIVGSIESRSPGSATISSCYNTGLLKSVGTDDSRLGGIVGHNGWGGGAHVINIDRCYSVGVVSKYANNNQGGLFGSPLAGASGVTISRCYWDTAVSKIISTYHTSGSYGLSSVEMKKQATFDSFSPKFSFAADTGWQIIEDSTYPGFREIDNAPFTFPEQFETETGKGSFAAMLANDWDIETGTANLVLRVESFTLNRSTVNAGTVTATDYCFPATSQDKDTAHITYRAGELLGNGDTLWGNASIATVVNKSIWANSSYAIYAGNNLAKDSLPNVASYGHGIPKLSTAELFDSTGAGVLWADQGEEHFAARGFAYTDSFSYVNARATSHIVAEVKVRNYDVGGNNTLLCEGFNKGNSTVRSTIRVRHRSGATDPAKDSLWLDLISFNVNASGVATSLNGAVVSASKPCPREIINNGKWLPIHLVVRPASTGSTTMAVDCYLGLSPDSTVARKLTLQFDPAKCNLVGGAGFTRTVEVPFDASGSGAASRPKTWVDESLGSDALAGTGGALVGDFAMISSNTMDRRGMVGSYLNSWDFRGTDINDSNFTMTEDVPIIQQILYAPPGDQSTASYAKGTEKTTSVAFSHGTDASLSIFAGYEQEITAGLFVQTKVGSFSMEAGVNMNMASNSSNEFTKTVTFTDGVETNQAKGDVVVAQTMLVKHVLLYRPRASHIFVPNDADASHSAYCIMTLPQPSQSAQQMMSVAEYLHYYSVVNPDSTAIKNLVAIYAKDTATGMLKASFKAQAGAGTSKILTGGITESFSKDITSSTTQTQSFSSSVGAYFNLKVGAGGFTGGFSTEFNVSQGEDKSSSASNTFSTSCVVNDKDLWDKITYTVYEDRRFGVPAFENITLNSYSTAPTEPNTQPTVLIDGAIAEQIPPCALGDTLICTLTVANNTSVIAGQHSGSVLLDQVRIKIEVEDNASTNYRILSITPENLFSLARGESRDVIVRYMGSVATKTPIGFKVNYGYPTPAGDVWVDYNVVLGTKPVLTKQTIGFPAITAKTYGDSRFVLGATASSGLKVSYAVNDTTIAALRGVDRDSVVIKKAGTVTITASQGGDDTAFVAARDTARSLVINPKSVTITGVTAEDKEYDGLTTATVSGGVVSGKVGSDVVTVTAGSGVFASKNVGTAVGVTASGYALGGAAVANYTLASQPSVAAADITAKDLAVVAEDQTKDVGADDPTLTWDATGFVTGESKSIMTGALSRDTGEAAGSYDITLGTLSAGSNYTIVFTKATLVIDNPSSIIEKGEGGVSSLKNMIAPAKNPVSLSDGSIDLIVLPDGASTIHLVICDAVGNVIDEQNGETSSGGSSYRFSWDLKNLDGVTVAEGGYLAVAKVKLANGSTKVYRTMIGVIR